MPVLKTAKIEFDRIELDVDGVFNYRTSIPEAGIKELAESIQQTGGCLQPVLVWHRRISGGSQGHVTGDGRVVYDRYILVAGRRRYEAIKRIRKHEGKEAFERIDVRLIEGNLDDALFAQGTENVQREDPSPAELAGWINNMVGRGHTQATIAKRLGKDPSWVCLAVAYFNRAAEPLREEAAKGGVSFDAAQAISHLPEEEQRAVVEEIRQEVKAAEQRGEEPNKARAKAAKKAAASARVQTERSNGAPSKSARVKAIEALLEGGEPKKGSAEWGAWRALLWSLGKKGWPRELPTLPTA